MRFLRRPEGAQEYAVHHPGEPAVANDAPTRLRRELSVSLIGQPPEII